MTVDLTCVVSRLFEQVDTKLPDLAAGPMQRDVATYTDPQRFARELHRLFRQYPICIGYTAELPEPGDYKTIEVAGVSMIVVRGKDRQVRVFKNACLHRGAPLVEADHGRDLKRFSCPFTAGTTTMKAGSRPYRRGAASHPWWPSSAPLARFPPRSK